MKKFNIFLPVLILSLLVGLSGVNAQNCSLFTGFGGDIFPDKRCAPVEATLQARFFSPAGPDVITNIKIRVNWADGSAPETFPASAYLSPDGVTWVYEIKNIKHTYPKGGEECNYEVLAFPVLNNTLECTSKFYKGNVTVWDTDDANGGAIALDPPQYFVCPGETISISFNDVSTWNCTPPLENDDPNYPSRWTQFVYGTNQTAGPRISGVLVDGVNQPSPFYDISQQRKHDPAPTDPPTPPAPNHQSRLITVPATAQVGEIYEITLRNWNTCNPYDDPTVAGGPANVQDGDFAPVITTAIIKIIPRPQGVVVTKNKNGVETTDFCPGEKVRFEGSQTQQGVVNVRYEWKIYNDAQGNELLETKVAKNWDWEAGFPTPGQKLVKLRVRNNEASNACWSETDYFVNVSAAPTVQPSIDGEAGNEKELCWNGGAQPVNFSFALHSGNNYKYLISLYKRNSVATAPDSTFFAEQLANGGQSVTAEHNAGIVKPGIYRIRLLATDRVTGCTTEKESRVVVAGSPKAAFSTADLCQGQAVTFTDASTISASVEGDALASWEWDVDYNGSSFSADYSGSEPVNHTYATAGTYKVALRVTSSRGCTDVLVKEVQVKPVPGAALSFNYTQPVCPGEPITFTNTSNNASSSFPEGISYTLVVSDGVSESRYSMTEPTRAQQFSNTSNALKTFQIWLEAKANAPNGCAGTSAPLEVQVKPGAIAGFTAPGYDALNPNCAPLELELLTNQATRDIQADRYIWTITQGASQQQIIKNRGDAEFESLRFTGLNTTAGSLTYTVRLVAEKADQCIVPAEEKYRVNPVPSADFTVTKIAESCDETTYEVQVSNASGIRSFNWTISPEPENQASVVYDDKFQLVYKRPAVGSAAYNVDLQLVTENFFDCASPAKTEQLTVQPQVLGEVKLVIVSGNDAGCSPLAVEFENQTGNAPAGTQYALMLRHGSNPEQEVQPLSGDLNARFSYNFVNEGTYTLWLKATAPDGCVRYQTTPLQLVVYPESRPWFSVDKTEGCGPLTVTFNKANITGATRTWTVTDLSTNQAVYGPMVFNPASGDNFNFIELSNTGTASKQYSIRLQTTSSQGCNADSTITVTVNPGPQAQFEVVPGTTLCEPYTLEVHNTSNNPQGTVYTWVWGDGTTSTSSNTTLTKTYTNNTSSTLNYTVRLLAQTPSGCSSEAVQQITVAPRVRPNVVPTVTAGCAPLQISFQNNSENAEIHSWQVRRKDTGAVVYTATSRIPDIPPLPNSGSSTLVYEVIYTAGNAQNCSSEQRHDISVYPGVVADFTMDRNTAACGPMEVSFTNTNVQEGVSYTWQWGDGSPAETSSDAQLIHTFQNERTDQTRYYEVMLTARNTSTGCTSVSRQMVTVGPAIQLAVRPDKEVICAPGEVKFTNSSQNISTHEWWYRLQGTTDKLEVRTTAEVQYQFTNTTAAVQVYEVVYVGTSSTGCAATSVHAITVYPSLDPYFTLDTDTPTLPDAVVNISNTTPHADAWTYSWNFGDGSAISTAVNPGSKRYTAFGVYTITLTISNGFCSATYSREVRVGDTAPIVDFESVPVAGCAPLPVSFVNKSQYTDPYSYEWNFGDGTRSREENPTHTYYRPGVYEVTLTASNSTGETRTMARKMVTVYEVPQANFDVWDRVVKVPGEAVRVANYSVGADSYLWDFGDGTTYTEKEPVHYYQQPGVYNITLIAKNQWGCADTLTLNEVVTAQAGGELKIPNAFTPDPSGPRGGYINPDDRDEWSRNNVFMPLMTGGVSKFNMKIYNRWGELMFESNDKNIGWDGYYKDRLCKSDVYAYKIYVEFSDGQSLQKIGDITLIR